MRTFSGHIYISTFYEQHFYELNFGGDQSTCTGFSDELLTGNRREHYSGEGPAWGYEGAGPDKVSINLLGRALDIRWPYCCGFGNIGTTHRQRPLILKLYKQFTAEIVANFGDKWSITDEEILKWVADKEKESQLNAAT